MGFGRQLHNLGSDLALSSLNSLFMAHEWISASYLRPQNHAAFGPLWLFHNSLLEEFVQEMHMSDEEPSDVLASTMSESSDEVSVAPAATAPAGKGLLHVP